MSKKVKGLIGFLLVTLMCAPTFVTMAANTSQEVIVSEKITNYDDGTSSIERTYVLMQAIPSATYGTDTFTKTKEWHTGLAGNGSLIIAAEVTGSFDWNSTTKK